MKVSWIAIALVCALLQWSAVAIKDQALDSLRDQSALTAYAERASIGDALTVGDLKIHKSRARRNRARAKAKIYSDDQCLSCTASRKRVYCRFDGDDWGCADVEESEECKDIVSGPKDCEWYTTTFRNIGVPVLEDPKPSKPVDDAPPPKPEEPKRPKLKMVKESLFTVDLNSNNYPEVIAKAFAEHDFLPTKKEIEKTGFQHFNEKYPHCVMKRRLLRGSMVRLLAAVDGPKCLFDGFAGSSVHYERVDLDKRELIGPFLPGSPIIALEALKEYKAPQDVVCVFNEYDQTKGNFQELFVKKVASDLKLPTKMEFFKTEFMSLDMKKIGSIAPVMFGFVDPYAFGTSSMDFMINNYFPATKTVTMTLNFATQGMRNQLKGAKKGTTKRETWVTMMELLGGQVTVTPTKSKDVVIKEGMPVDDFRQKELGPFLDSVKLPLKTLEEMNGVGKNEWDSCIDLALLRYYANQLNKTKRIFCDPAYAVAMCDSKGIIYWLVFASTDEKFLGVWKDAVMEQMQQKMISVKKTKTGIEYLAVDDDDLEV